MAATESDVEPSETAPPPGGYGPQGLPYAQVWCAVVMIALVSVFAQIDRFIITLLVTPIKRDLSLTDTELSLLIGLAFSMFYAAASLPLARLADSWSRKQVLSWALAAWSLATMACGLAQSFVQFFAFRGIVGACEGVKSPCSTSMIADLVPRDRLPRALAIFNLATNGGAALALMIGGALLAIFAGMHTVHVPGIGPLRDWQLIFFIVGLPGVLFAILLLATLPEPQRTRAQAKEQVSIAEIWRLIVEHRAVFAPMLLISTLNAIQAGGLAAWRPSFFERTYGWTPDVTGPLLGSTYLLACAIAFFVGTWFAEWLAKRHNDSNMRVVLIAQALATPLMTLSPLAPTGAIALAMITIASTLTIGAAPAQIAALQIVTPGPMRSQISALYFITLNVLGVAGGPLAVAFMTDSVFGDEALLRYSLVVLVLVFAPASLALNWLILKPYARHVRAQN